MIKCFDPEISVEEITAAVNTFNEKELSFSYLVDLFEKKFKRISKKKYNVALNSASAASFIYFAWLKDRFDTCNIFVPSITFTSPVWSANHFGHHCIVVDVDDSLNISQDSLNAIISNNSYNDHPNVLFPTLYGGISHIPIQHNDILHTIIDSAHCVTHRTNSHCIFFSFHPQKPIHMTSGGILATDDEDLYNYTLLYRNFGRQNNSYTYDIVQDGFKFYMNGLDAALGLAQLDKYKQRIRNRKYNYEYISDKLKDSFTFISHDKYSSYQLCTILLDKIDNYHAIQFMSKNKIQCSIHYPPIYQSEYKICVYNIEYLSNTEKLKDKILNIPIHESLTHEQLDTICDTLCLMKKELSQ